MRRRLPYRPLRAWRRTTDRRRTPDRTTGHPTGRTTERAPGARSARRRAPTAGTAAGLVLAMALTATSCGLLGSEGTDDRDLTGTVTWWDTSNEAEAPTFDRLTEEFERQYPNIDVTRVSVPFDQARQRYLDAVADGQGVPDVLRADVGWTTDFVDRGLLADLTDTPALEDGLADFLPLTTSTVTRGPAVYGVPQVTDALALLYNKELLERSDIDRPPETWQELKRDALRIRERTGAYGLGLDTDAYYAQPFVHAERGDFLDPEAKEITLSAPAAVRGVRTAADLVASGAARRPPARGAHATMQEDFKAGRTAMVINGPWSVADSLTGAAFTGRDNLGIAAVPAGSTGVSGSPTGGHNLVVSASSPNLRAAQLLTGFLTATEQQERIATTLGLLPTRTSAYSDAVLADPVRNSFYLALTKAVPRTPIPENGRLLDLLQPHYARILRGEVPAAEGLRAAAEQWQAELPGGYVIRE